MADKPRRKAVMYNGYEFIVSSDGKYVEVDGIEKNIYASKQHRAGSYKTTVRNLISYKRATFAVRRLVALAFIKNDAPNRNTMAIGLDPKKPLEDDYRGLIWGNRSDIWKIKLGAGTAEPYTSRAYSKTRSKIPISDFWEIARRLDNGEFARSIAKEYDTSEMSIQRIRSHYARTRKVCFEIKQEYKQEVLVGLRSYLMSDKKNTKRKYAVLNGIRYETLWRWEKQFDKILNL